MKRFEAIVVGGGIVGAACAEALAHVGGDVRLLERGYIAGGATAAGMGHVLVLDDSDAQLALTRVSRALWAERWSQLPTAIERDTCGTIWVAADDDELAAAAKRADAYAAHGIETELLDAQALYAYEPHLRHGLAGGLRIPGDRVLYPPAAARHLLDRAVAAGADVLEQTPVRRAGDGHVDLADGSRFEADLVVIAAGLESPALVDVPGLVIRAKKGHLSITDRCPGLVRHQLIELGYLNSAHGNAATSVAFNLQPRATGQILIGSSRQLDDTDPRVDHGIVSRMLARATVYLPALGSVPIVRTWTGFRPATPDHLPIIGPLPGAPGLWLATGHEGFGIATALGTARLLVDQWLGRQPIIDPRPFHAERLTAPGPATVVAASPSHDSPLPPQAA